MKKSLLSILSLILCGIMLAGCGGSTGAETEKVNIRKVINIELETLSGDESREMINYMSAGRACVSEGRLYTMEFNKNLEPCLGVWSLGNEGPEDFKILAEPCLAEYLTVHGSRLYYINTFDGGSIESMNTDGSDRKTLREGPCDFLRPLGDSLYYCDSRGRFCKSSLEGLGEEIILPEACYYPYIKGDKLLYQKGRNEHIYLYSFSDGSDMEITDIPAYAPVIIEDRLYCSLSDGVYSTDLEGMEPVKFELRGIQGTVQYEIEEKGVRISGLTDSDGIHNFSFSTEDVKGSFEKNPGGTYRVREFTGEDCAVYTVFEPTGRIKNFVFLSPTGREIKYFKGEIR